MIWLTKGLVAGCAVTDGRLARTARARVVRGRWDVTPAIHPHTELHRVRPDARVVVHNHPYYVSVIAALGTLPELVHQTGSHPLMTQAFLGLALFCLGYPEQALAQPRS